MKQPQATMNRQRVTGLVQVPIPEPLTPREEAIQILAEGLLKLVIQRSRKPESRVNRREHWLRVQMGNEN